MRKRICSLFLVVALLLTALVAVLPAAAEDSAEVAALKADPTKSWQEIARQIIAEIVDTLDKETYNTDNKQYTQALKLYMMPTEMAANTTVGGSAVPILIDSPEDLAIFSLYGYAIVTGRWKMNADIDLTGHPWEPSTQELQGTTLWGNNKTISNMTITSIPATNAGGLCGKLTGRGTPVGVNDGKIDNLTINAKVGTEEKPVNISKWFGIVAGSFYGAIATATDSEFGKISELKNVHVNAQLYATMTDATYIGGFAGYSHNSILSNCSVSGNLTVTASHTKSASSTLGGFLGRVSGTKITNCENKANVTYYGPSGASNYAGGFVGHIELNQGASQIFKNCVNYGTITLQAKNYRLGGICGEIKTVNTAAETSFDQCANYGQLVWLVGGGTSGMAGIIGFDEGKLMATVTNCFVIDASVYYRHGSGYGYLINNGASTGNVALGLSALDLSTSAGAQIRLKEGSSGLRFNATLNKSAIESLLAQTGVTVSVGMLIAPTAHVTAAGKFTKEALDAYKAATPALAEIDIYRDVKVDKKADSTFWWFSEENGTCSFNAALANLYAENFDVAFSAIAYVTVTANGKTFTVYGNFDDDVNDVTRTIDGTAMTWYGGQSYNEADQSRTVRFVAQAAMNDRSETVEGKYVNNVAAAYPSANGAYSPYTEAQLAMVNAFLA